jgi:3-hydroxybutyrate dehydrogenase
MNLSGKNVLITGGGTGVGAAMAEAFVNAGANVCIAGRRCAPLEHVAQRLPSVMTLIADVTDENSVADMFELAGPVNIVIANAGAALSSPFSKTTLADWNAMTQVNLTGVFLTLRAGLNAMSGWGRLISVASTAGLKGYPYVAAYAAAKHGVIGLTRSVALEVASTAITINALCPGFLDTEMTSRSVATIMEKTKMTKDQAKASLAKHNPQGRLIHPREVAQAALWLCGPGSGSINGQAIAISGGEI